MISLNDIEQEFGIIKTGFPNLNKLVETDKLFCIEGSLSIIDSNGYNWGEYKIRILIPKTYPFDLPVLEETAGAIVRDRSWHISKEGICCVGTLARQYRDMSDGITIIKWINLFVIPYLANHAYKRDMNDYVDGELAHDEEGIFQDYASCFELNNPKEVIERLSYVLGFLRPSLNARCFCDRGKKYKRCFLVNSQSHQLGIPSKVLKNDLKKLKTYYKT